MDLRITFDLSERAHATLVGIAEAFRDMVVRGGYLREEREALHEKYTEDAQAHAQIVEPVEPQTDDEPEQLAEQEAVVAVVAAVPGPAPESAPKRGRGRPPKKRENLAPVSAISAPADNPAPAEPEEPATPTTAPTTVAEEPATPTTAPTTVAEKSEDPYHGMTLMQAVSALMAEVHDTGVELADANARVRKECEARGLPYNSAACLMKELGYDATRKIALGFN